MCCEGTDGIVTRLLHSNKRSAVRKTTSTIHVQRNRENRRRSFLIAQMFHRIYTVHPQVFHSLTGTDPHVR